MDRQEVEFYKSPNNDPFGIIELCDDEKQSQSNIEIYEAFKDGICNDQVIGVTFTRKLYVHLFGAIFNNTYLHGGATDFVNTEEYIKRAINEDVSACNNQGMARRRYQRVYGLILHQ